jgi:hypothetical protein
MGVLPFTAVARTLPSLRLGLEAAVRRASAKLADDRGDLSAYLAQGVLALAAVSLTGVVLAVFSSVGAHLQAIVSSWLNVPISTGG